MSTSTTIATSFSSEIAHLLRSTTKTTKTQVTAMKSMACAAIIIPTASTESDILRAADTDEHYYK
jgi:hypothetical protein